MSTQNLKGKVALVTGSGDGIGKAIAVELAYHGSDVIINDIKDDLANKVASEIRDFGRESLAVIANVANSEDVQRMVKASLDKFGKIDILVNNVGINAIDTIIDLDERIWDKAFEVNVKSAFLCSKYVAPSMIKQRSGKIVNISSIAGKLGFAAHAAYCSTKFALIGLTESVARDLAKYNINVNAVCPGFVYTPMWEYIWNKVGKEKASTPREFYDQNIKAQIPLGRPQTPEDIAKAVAFLCSSESDNITGESIKVAGGWPSGF